MKFRILPLLLILFISACSIAEEKKMLSQQQTLNIPDDIKPLLSKEMFAIEKAMKVLVSTIATADWDKTAEIAKQIQASYIMKQSLTAKQMQQLHHSLPKQFITLDHSFHQYAGMLAHAAEVKNQDVVNFYFYKMNDSCVQCHSRFAQNKFSGFSRLTEKHHAH
ncbi:MAG: hypothetical protein ACKE51_04525 [Methylococcaceae bacterium]